MSRSIFIGLAALLAFALVLDQVSSMPAGGHHKRHSRCVERVFKTLITLCNHKGNAEIMRQTALTCCEINCDLMELMASCSGKSKSEEAEDSENIKDIQETDLFRS
ncbi:hypothetical protein CAEBREN_20142 [Caenorhabditis brenneri]|uniref:Uncharacterized protein n=1 Tax=Caenorhabditis brenneri TaxID=135651 RepID=G0PJK9_CAEBE|nr:hypothetical protein CAEBREN_20142 [Caenorhabditis brenneri]